MGWVRVIRLEQITMLMVMARRAAIRTPQGWAISVLLEAGAIRECEEHGWMIDRADPHARDRALAIARQEPPFGLSSDKAEVSDPAFQGFVGVAKFHAELTRSDPLLHRSVPGAVNGLADFLEVERKRVPDHVLRDAERLKCLLFSGYDPHFEGDEPPGL